MPSFTFNHALADRIADSINGSPKTAREIAKELHEDKHLINQHLYKMEDLVRSDDKVPVWSLPDSDEEDEEDEEDEGDEAASAPASKPSVTSRGWPCAKAARIGPRPASLRGK